MTDLHESDSDRDLATTILADLARRYEGKLTPGVVRALISHLEWLLAGVLGS